MFFFFNYFYFLAVLGLLCVAFSDFHERGLLFIAMCRLLSRVAFLVVEHRLQGTWVSVVAAHRLRNYGAWASLLCGVWNLHRPGLNPPCVPFIGSGLHCSTRAVQNETFERDYELFYKTCDFTKCAGFSRRACSLWISLTIQQTFYWLPINRHYILWGSSKWRGIWLLL